ncbi:MAG: S1 RNA-binding domain-containing protein [Syntrophales bacterium]
MGTEEKEKTFAELLGEHPPERERLRPGQAIEAAIVKITPEWVFIDLGEKSEGFVDQKEFLDDRGELKVREGDVIRAFFLSSARGEKRFTTRIADDSSRNFLENAWKNRIPVEGVIEKEVKGGYEVKVGAVRAFCPYSQAGRTRAGEPGQLAGKRLEFLITEFGKKGKNIVLSHRALLEQQARKRKEELREVLKEGQKVRGRVAGIRQFGAFLDLGGIEGLIPVTEMAWGAVENAADLLKVGEEVEATIIKLDWDRDRITLSLKGNLPDPWEQVGRKYAEGTSHPGKVARLTDFGAFITLEPGVDGLIHISRLAKGKRIKHAREALEQGQAVTVRIGKIESDKKRLSLELAGRDSEEGEEADFRAYAKNGSRSFGSFADIMKSREGRKGRK